MRLIALAAIRGYQRFASPYKRFCCAYSFHTGNRSCSALGYRAIRSRGVLQGIAILQSRFERCHLAYMRYGSRVGPPQVQRGVCDVACIPCDVPPVDCAPTSCDIASACAPSPCDCASLWKSTPSKRSNSNEYVPPQRQREHEARATELRDDDA